MSLKELKESCAYLLFRTTGWGHTFWLKKMNDPCKLMPYTFSAKVPIFKLLKA